MRGLSLPGPAGEPVRLEVASRTDRGVSARANALALTSSLPGPPLLRRLNGIAPEVFFTAAVRIPDEFRVRSATRRIYRYFEPLDGADPDRRREAAEQFRGPVDVRSFGRGIPGGAPCFRPVESVSVAVRSGGLVTEVRAPSFVWGMVRKIVSALREHDAGRLPLDRLDDAVHGRRRLSLPLAEPEGLVLWEAEFPVRWEYRWTGPNRHQTRWVSAARRNLWVRARVLRTLGATPGPMHRPVRAPGRTA